ncbi:protein-disulfide reductase DsbD [Rheinheimera sp. UJ63]|uniref:protein-disulfide reductase DsbD n=1 Tax=Rheinheimera sp. UJ63 TaxID=2910157 RepID=UPI001F3FF874|nr:protein-disulfide reductase DsbD [Rheinheimera sp. UJ63]MCF4008341.1 protein-disulfide reductase DsbD [Rheinheimera sp. UJ63]
MIIKRFYLLLLSLVLTLALTGFAQAQQSNALANNNSVLNSLLQAQPQFLPVEQAFVLDYRQQDGALLLNWTIADGYYMYRDKFKLGGVAVSFSHPTYPASMTIEDEFFGKTEVYYHQLQLKIPLSDIDEDAIFRVQYMGCAEAGFCYPPKSVDIPLLQLTDGTALPSTVDIDTDTSSNAISSQYGLMDKLNQGSLLASLGVFFLLGLGLSFTPCVFPMYPILSGIIVGQGKQLSTRRAFGLSMSYVQGMALTYSALGLVVASLGVKFQAWLQHPSVLIVASVIFVVLALAMFGVFNFQLPSSWQAKISGLSNKQQGGSLKGAFVMGALSGLIASPCTTAPLSAALLYVAQSGDLVIGALTLYILSLGMGLPLLLLGTSGGRLLPKAGNWMNAVKNIFGFLLLAVPLILLERFLPYSTILLMGTGLTLVLVVYLYRLLFTLQNPSGKAILAVIAQLLLLGAFWLNLNHWRPASTLAAPSPQSSEQAGFNVNALGFIEIETAEDLAEQLKLAAAAGQYTMVDLYAEWCVACKEFEQLTFPKPEVTALTSQMRLIKIDVTRMSRADAALLDSYQVLGLPTLLFFAPDGTELTQSRVTGFQAAAPFAAHLNSIIN